MAPQLLEGPRTSPSLPSLSVGQRKVPVPLSAQIAGDESLAGNRSPVNTEELMTPYQSDFKSFLGGYLSLDLESNSVPWVRLRSPHAASSPRRLKTPCSFVLARQEKVAPPAQNLERVGGGLQELPPTTPCAKVSPRRERLPASPTGDCFEGLPSRDELSARRRETCECLRLLVFGRIGNEDWLPQDRPNLFLQKRGTPAEVETFAEVWVGMDDAGSGEVDLADFADFFKRGKVDRFLGLRCVRYLMDLQDEEDGSAGKKPRGLARGRIVTLQELLRLVWAGAGDTEVAEMTVILDHYRLCKIAVEPPPLLAKKRQKELTASFNELDKEGVGKVPYPLLVQDGKGGFVDEAMVAVLQKKYDRDRSGHFDLDAFLEMMCPPGRRAHPRVRSVVCKDGRALRFVEWAASSLSFEGWLRVEDFEVLRERYGFQD